MGWVKLVAFWGLWRTQKPKGLGGKPFKFKNKRGPIGLTKEFNLPPGFFHPKINLGWFFNLKKRALFFFFETLGPWVPNPVSTTRCTVPFIKLWGSGGQSFSKFISPHVLSLKPRGNFIRPKWWFTGGKLSPQKNLGREKHPIFLAPK